MELNKKTKTAVSLIELLVALVMTSVLMLMLFGIVSKKAKNGFVHQEGIFYCWKDWEGSLYQKTTSDSIQHVSNCKIKIPKDAKNIQVFLIGGGAGGYKFSQATINDLLKKGYSKNSDNTEDKPCISPKGNKISNIYTKLITNGGEKYTIMTNCKTSSPKNPLGCEDNITLDSGDYKSLGELTESPNENGYFKKSFIEDLFSRGHCNIPIYKVSSNGQVELKYLKSNSDMARENIYYYKGSTTKGGCQGESKNAGTVGVNGNGDGYCYQEGVLKSKNTNYSQLASAASFNKLEYMYINSSVNIGTFQESSAGEFKRGSAEAGRDYTINANDVGSGGSAGENGGTTKFGNLKASGGALKPAVNLIINLPSINKIGNISDLDKKETLSICATTGMNCNGTMSSQLKELASDTKIKVNSSVEIKPSEYTNGKWKQSTSFIRTSNEIEKTGFGFFGAGAAATDCTVSYYPIKTISYNDFKIENTSSREAKIDSCANKEHGMGGAIIIKWD